VRTSFKLGLVVTSVLMGCSHTVNVASQGERQAPPPLRQIPGVTAADQFPRGCVDCHVKRPDLDKDVRLSAQMRQWQDQVDPILLARVRAFSPSNMRIQGRHPEMPGGLADIPNDCLSCHSKTSDSAPPFGRLLHGLHLAGGAENHFVAIFQGECTHCHKLVAATGSFKLANGSEQ